MNDSAKTPEASQSRATRERSPQVVALSDRLFYTCLGVIGGVYVLLIVAMLVADAAYMIEDTVDAASRPARDAQAGVDSAKSAVDRARERIDEIEASPQPSKSSIEDADRALRQAGILIDDAQDAIDQWQQHRVLHSVWSDNPVMDALRDRRIRYSIWLSLISCSLTAILSVFVAVPIGYLLSRHRFPGKRLVDAILDVPIVLPPLVVGLSLLILFQFPPFSWSARSIVYQVPAVILAQFAVAGAFAVRTMKATFDHINPRCEEVALTLGCTRLEAFGWVVLPESTRGMTTAATLAWARALGEFGPLLIFAGTTRMKTEVLSTSVFLELNVGKISAAVAVSLIMVFAAMIVLILARLFGSRDVAL